MEALALIEYALAGGVGAFAGAATGFYATRAARAENRLSALQKYREAESHWFTKEGALLLGVKNNKPFWFTGSEMGVTIGSTGSQKFTAAVAPNLLIYSGSCFVIDPKGEICAVTAQARHQRHRQQVYRLDPFNKTEFAPGTYVPPLASYNPLDVLDPNSETFVSDAATLTEALILPGKGSENPYWSNAAKRLINALIVFTCEYYRDSQGVDDKVSRNLTQVYEFITADEETWEWLLAQMANSDFLVVKTFATQHKRTPEETRGGIIEHAATELNFLAYPEVAKTIGQSSENFRLENLFTGRCTVYVVLPAERLGSHNRWLRLMLAASLMTAARFKKTDLPVTQNNDPLTVLWLIDEAAQLGRMEDIPRAYGLMRAYGVRIWTFWQDLGQLKATYPEHWSSLLGNSFNQLMSCGDEETAKYFANLAGKQEVEKVSVTEGTSHTTGNSSGSGGGSSGNNTSSSWNRGKNESSTTSHSETKSKQWEERIQIDQVLAMPTDKMLVRLPNQLPQFLEKWPYHEDDNLNTTAVDNPYHHR